MFYYRLNYLAAYLQDSWKATQRLTINAGIRWEPYLPVYVDDIGLSYFDRSWFDQGIKSTVFVNAPAGLKFPGDPGVPGNRRVGYHHLWDFAPRLGIAWDPTGNGSMSIRAAYGIFYNRPNLTTYGGYSSAAPNGSQVSLNFPSSFDDPWKDYAGGDPFPVRVTKDFVFPAQGNYFPFELNAKSTYQNQWNLSLQKQIGSDWLVSGSYVGSSIIHLWTLNKSNPGVFLGLPQSTNANLNQRRILYLANPAEGRSYGDMQSGESGGTGNYHGMLVSIERRQANGLTMRTNYTWSHCIADLVATSQTASAVTKPFDRSSSRGNCGNSDRRHVFNTSTVYETPQFANNVLRKLAGRWQVSGIVRIMSGSYFNVAAGTDRALTGAPNQLGVQLLADPYMANKTDLWSNNNLYLNPAAFAIPALGTYGNMGTNAIRGPGSIRIDMGLSRTFQIRERQSLQFRVEAFNLPNHLNPSNPVSSLNNTTNFGKILNSDDPRIMQAALKYVF